MKFSTEHSAVICEKCGKLGPSGETPQLMMKLAVLTAGFGYAWEHGSTHIAHFYCDVCKHEFDCEEVRQ